MFLSSVVFLVPSNEVHLRRSKNNIPRARMRTLKMSIVIVSSFIICWTPYYLLGLWYWFFPDDLEGKVSHSLTHILFIFGLVNACLDPVIYGLFTIHFRTGLRRYYRNATVASDLDNNTVITGSFTCAANSLQLKREVSPVSQERFMLCSDSRSREESTPSRSSFLTADNDAERDPQQNCSDSIIWRNHRAEAPWWLLRPVCDCFIRSVSDWVVYSLKTTCHFGLVQKSFHVSVVNTKLVESTELEGGGGGREAS